MIYDVIIIGAGASGLFAAANIKLKKGQHGLILDKAKTPGLKLLMAGSGQCNVTHAGDIKDFVTHYGPAGKKIRSIIYNFSNEMLHDWFSARGLKLITRDDGKVFPETMSSRTVLDLFLKESRKNGFDLLSSRDVISITPSENDSIAAPSDGSAVRITSLTQRDAGACALRAVSEIRAEHHADVKASSITVTAAGPKGKETYAARHLIIATGGCSYPTTGSDGAIFSVLADLGLDIVPCRPALVPLSVENYPYSELSGNSVKGALVSIYEGRQKSKKSPSMYGDVLMTHKDFSGPGIIDMSRYARNGYTLDINWLPEKSPETIISDLHSKRSGNKKQLISVLTEYFPMLSQAHLRVLCQRADADPSTRFTDVKNDAIKTMIRFITADTFTISGTSGFKTAMATCGGVSLSEISASTMECKKQPGIHILGEALDVDGDTGGYNLQFAFSSAMRAADHIKSIL